MSRFATRFPRRGRHGCLCRTAHRPHDSIAPRPRRRRARPPSHRSARSRTAVRPRMDLSRRARCAARQALPRHTDDVLHRRRPASSRVPLAAMARGGVSTESGRGAGRAGCSCRQTLPAHRPGLSRPTSDVRNLLEHRRVRHHRLADRRARTVHGLRACAHDPDGRHCAGPHHVIDRYRASCRSSVRYVDKHVTSAHGGDTRHEDCRIATGHAPCRASSGVASHKGNVRRAARRRCIAASNKRHAHDSGPGPDTDRAATGCTSASPEQCSQHSRPRSARPAAALDGHTRCTRHTRRSAHADRDGKYAARRAACPCGACAGRRFRLDIATVPSPRDRHTGRVRALTVAQ